MSLDVGDRTSTGKMLLAITESWCRGSQEQGTLKRARYIKAESGHSESEKGQTFCSGSAWDIVFWSDPWQTGPPEWRDAPSGK